MLTRSTRARANRQRHHALLLGGGVVATILVGFSNPAQALPTGGAVTNGSATITAGRSQLTVNQSTQNAVINWQTFGIGATEGVTFVQPNSTAVALNRVVGQDPTAILGSLTANGRVFVVNPNGVLFGRTAQVNVGGLVASTLGIADSDFMAGTYRFTGGGSGAVVNEGSIAANGGFVALLGANVQQYRSRFGATRHGGACRRIGRNARRRPRPAECRRRPRRGRRGGAQTAESCGPTAARSS